MAPAKTVAIKSPRKLIEVALPLDKINAAAAREKSIRHGHPSSLHLWWARRPLAAARAVLFGQLVNDPGYERHLNRGVNKVEAARERERLFKILEDLVVWENTNDSNVIGAARTEIWNSWKETCELNRNHPDAAALFDPNKLPAFHDPFAGGGAIPLEAQRLGLVSYASDLNPVAVTINKAMIEIPPLFANRVPLGPVPTGERDPSLSRSDWPAASGLAEDVRRYGAWMRCEAEKRVGHLYPNVEITESMATDRPDLRPLVGQSLTVIAWIWARTVKSPNPAYSEVRVPLISSFILSSKAGKGAYIEPVVDGQEYSFRIKLGPPTEAAATGTKLGRGANFRCLVSNTPIEPRYIKDEALAGQMGDRMMAIVAEGPRGRVFLPPTAVHEEISKQAPDVDFPSTAVANDPRAFTPILYGFNSFDKLFTARQKAVLQAFADLVPLTIEKCFQDYLSGAHEILDSEIQSRTLANGVGTYLAFLVDQMANHCSSFCGWNHPNTQMRSVFSRQALAMTWDFAETNVFSDSSGSFNNLIERQVKAFETLGRGVPGFAVQADAATQTISVDKIVSTDPPYYDNIPYADLSDFFYVWLRKSLRFIYPEAFATLTVPKADELVASPYRHGGKDAADSFFLEGMSKAINGFSEKAHQAFPVTIFYAFKQADGESDSVSSSGWVSFLDAVIKSGFSITGTWPMRTEGSGRMRGNDSNALASSIILVCRKRESNARTISRREFLRELQAVLPDALIDMTRGGDNSPVAPVDLSQAIIGPGMGIFSKYKAVLEADGKPMSVRTALQLINRFLADDEFDGETQFCIQWLESYGWKAADYGSADTLAQAKGAVLSHMNREGLLTSGGGTVQLIRWQELNADWIPERQNLTPVWQALHQLIANLQTHGEQSTGALLAAMPAVSGRVRTLAYRLYTLAERKGLAEDARPYNELIGAWSAIELAAAEVGPIETQVELF
jgi:putative DNA methylase